MFLSALPLALTEPHERFFSRLLPKMRQTVPPKPWEQPGAAQRGQREVSRVDAAHAHTRSLGGDCALLERRTTLPTSAAPSATPTSG